MRSLFKKIIAIFFCVAHLFQVSYAAGLLPNTTSCVPEPSSQCVDNQPCKTRGGVTVCLDGAASAPPGASFVPDTCWEYEKTYSCQRYVDTCSRYSSDANCVQQGPKTCGTDGSGLPMVNAAGDCTYFKTDYKCSNPENNPEAVQTYTDGSCTQSYEPENKSCYQDVVPHVNLAAACEPGTILNEKTVSRTGGPMSGPDLIRFRAMCDMSGSLTFAVHAWGGSGSCASEQTFTTPKNILSNSHIATVTPHWSSTCQTNNVNVIAGSTCDGTTCNFKFTVGASSVINLTFAEPSGVTSVTDTLVDGCGGIAAEPSCVHQETACAEGVGETRMIDGQAITRACWKYEKKYACEQFVDTCTPYTTNAACVPSAPPACNTDASGNPIVDAAGNCTSVINQYTCADPIPTHAEVESHASCNLGDIASSMSWTIPTNSAQADFVEAATTQEFARQLVAYGKNDENGIKDLFVGQPYGCREGSFGLRNCCDPDDVGPAMDNNQVMNGILQDAAMSAVAPYAGQAVSVGSMYVYDTLGTALVDTMPGFVADGVTNTLQNGMNNTIGAGGGIGAFGFGTSASAAGGLFGGGASVSVGSIAGNPIFFNPYALAFAVAIQVVMQAMSCNEEEISLAKFRSKNLCQHVGQYCSSKIMVLGVQVGCNETTDSYCCYNGLLAKGIQEGAHAQLGLSWGSPESPDCRGLTMEQITQIDFSSPEMTSAMGSFKEEIMNKYNANAGKYLSDGTVKGYMEVGTRDNAQTLCLQRQKLDPSTVCQ